MLVAVLLVVRDEELGAWDVLWISLLLLSLVELLAQVGRTVRRERQERRRAAAVAAIDAEDVAQRAVVEERVRLTADTEAVIRSSTVRMRTLAQQALARQDGSTVPVARQIQQEGQRAVSELRRMLGLLREAGREETPPALPLPQPVLRPGDVALAGVVVALAVAERHVYGDLAVVGPPGSTSLLSLVSTALTAGTVVLRRGAPGAGAALAAAGFLAGAVGGHPVTGGIWMIGALGGLAWSATSAGRRSWLGAVALFVGVLVAQAWRYPSNLTVTAVIVAVPAVAGALVAWRRAHAAVARDRADRGAAELAAARDAAVRGERLSVARELHDVVSHAVGVMVVQAGAAEALHAVDPARSTAALQVVQRVAEDALAELDRLVSVLAAGAVGSQRTASGVEAPGVRDLAALVDRMRSAGLSVELRLAAALDPQAAATVYRIVQESLTNVLRHARGARVRVGISSQEGAVLLEVRDDGPGPGGDSGRGYGLVGIGERVQRLGGTLTTGAGPDGRGFVVRARLPDATGCTPPVRP